MKILRELHALSGHGEFVFPGARSNGRAMSDAAVNAALRRIGYNTRTEITGHGFRAMARTILHQEIGIAPEIIEHQLAHRVSDNLGDSLQPHEIHKGTPQDDAAMGRLSR